MTTDRKVEMCVCPLCLRQRANDEMQRRGDALREHITHTYPNSRERALALTKLDEVELWLTRCELMLSSLATHKETSG